MIVVFVTMLITPAIASAQTVSEALWSQGFEVDTSGWVGSGTVTRVPSGTGGITSSEGAFHASVTGTPNTQFGEYRSVWPGGYITTIDIYLDTNWTAGSGFDYTVAANGTDGLHQRDFVFHVSKDTSTGNLMVAGSNNTNFAMREDLDTLPNFYTVSQSGWYTFQHVFYENAGVLTVDMNLLDSNGTILFTETRSTPEDTIPAEVGGNRYGWFTFITVAGGISIDDVQLIIERDLTPNEMMDNLQTNTADLVDNAAAERALLATLNRAEMFMNANRPLMAYLTMVQYIIQVERYEDSRRIPSTVAGELVSQARDVTRVMFQRPR
jgi:hypothetical protein